MWGQCPTTSSSLSPQQVSSLRSGRVKPCPQGLSAGQARVMTWALIPSRAMLRPLPSGPCEAAVEHTGQEEEERLESRLLLQDTAAGGGQTTPPSRQEPRRERKEEQE